MQLNSNNGWSLGGRKARKLRREHARKMKQIGARKLGKRRFEHINPVRDPDDDARHNQCLNDIERGK